MKKSSGRFCDICGEIIPFEIVCPVQRIWERAHYSVKFISRVRVETDEMKPVHNKIKMDICQPCWQKMAEWIKMQGEKHESISSP